DVAATVELLDQAALEPARCGTVAARAAADRAAGEHVAAAARLLQRDRVRVVAGRRAQAADLLLPLRRADSAHLQQPRNSDAVRRRLGRREGDPAAVRGGLHVSGCEVELDAVQDVRVVLHVRAGCREAPAATATA